ncbi:MAG: histidinol-phosphatase [Bacteroidota bacterium]|nr:histidinol-phosphatase [Bacteroidota bacterium]
MKRYNIHTHSTYCDGKASLETMVKAAIAKNFKILGFSSHAPMPFENYFSIVNHTELKKYCDEVRSLAEKYRSQIKIHLSLEIDFISGITTPFASFREECGLDYTIGAVHLVKNNKNNLWFIDGGDIDIYDDGLKTLFDNDIRKAVKTYYHQVNEMITTQKPDMVAHFDKIKMNNKGRYFSENEQWYVDLVDETLENIKANNCVMEINTRGIYKGRSEVLFPGTEIIRKAKDLKIPMSLNTDAHHPNDLDGHYDETIKMLNKMGVYTSWYFDSGEWRDITL